MQRNNNIPFGSGDEENLESEERRFSHSRKRSYREVRRYERKRSSGSPACGINARRQRRYGC